MNALNVATRRGTVLNGALFLSPVKADILVIAITGIHGNFYSNPFYYDIGGVLNTAGIDFAYAQTRNAFGVIKTRNVLTKKEETIGSWNERFADTDEDIAAYLDEAERRGYRHIVLAGHSLGAKKVIYYLSRHHDPRVEHFILMNPANVDYMTSGVTREEREIVASLMAQGRGDEMLPFPLMGWVDCTVATAATTASAARRKTAPASLWRFSRRCASGQAPDSSWRSRSPTTTASREVSCLTIS